jgi:soluble lytic murein transglycosylase-like protein
MLRICAPFIATALALTPLSAAADDIFFRDPAGQSVVISNVPDTDDFSLLLAGPPDAAGVQAAGKLTAVVKPVAPLSLANLLDRARRYDHLVDHAARESKLDAHLLHAVIAAESAYDAAALSPKGAVGMMQLMPATARRYGVADSLDARQNIHGGARYLADLLRLFNNDTGLALAAYNAGENAVLRNGRKIPPYRETEVYVPRVLSLYRHFESAAL